MLHDLNAAVVDAERDRGHRRIDFTAIDGARRRGVAVEHGALHTVQEAPMAQEFIARFVRPALQSAIASQLQGITRMRLLSKRGRVPRNIVELVLRAVREDPALLAPGQHRIEVAGRLLGYVAVGRSPRPGHGLLVGPAVDAERADVVGDMRIRLQAVVTETATKFGAVLLAPGVAWDRLLLVEADDRWNLSDETYAELFESIVPDARRAGLSAVWRVAADSAKETHYWQQWDSRTQVPERPRFFSWVHASGMVREI